MTVITEQQQRTADVYKRQHLHFVGQYVSVCEIRKVSVCAYLNAKMGATFTPQIRVFQYIFKFNAFV